jgi:ecotropic viral integration site 5 protein
LRSENRLLKKRNELLEAESAELADRLVRGQVSRAEEEETRYSIKYISETHLTIGVPCLNCFHFPLFFTFFHSSNSYAIQSELLALRRAHLEVSHQLENSHEEIRGLSLRLQENVSIFRFFFVIEKSTISSFL